MTPTKNKNCKKSINDYVNKEKFAKRECFEDKTAIEVRNIVSRLSQDCISKFTDQGKKIRDLYAVIESKTHGKSIILRKSVLVSLCIIFKDVLPTYKITILSDQQKQQNMKNETIKSYSEQEILLGYYYKYICLIESVLGRKYDNENLKHIQWTESDELSLLKCACSLYLNNPNFNYATSLLKIIILQLNSTNSKMLRYASNAICTAINDDLRLDASLQICQIIKQYAIDNKFNIRFTVLKPLANLELEDVSLSENKKVKDKVKKTLLSRKGKKDMKKSKQYMEQLEQINAKETLEIKSKKNSQILSIVFYVYLRILKKTKIQSKLLEVVLESVGKFGRLVDCKLMPDIFSIMYKISDNPNVSMENRLRCLFVSLNIITSGKASEILDIDPGNLSNKLISLASNCNLSETSTLLILSCCTKLLVKRRNHISQIDAERIIKVLITLAWSCKNTPPICCTILISIIKYLRIYPQLQYLFDEDEEIFLDVSHNQMTREAVESNEYLKYLHDLSKFSVSEIAEVAKKIKRFFVETDDNRIFELTVLMEELVRMKTDECLDHLKKWLLKRIQTDNDSSRHNKKIKI